MNKYVQNRDVKSVMESPIDLGPVLRYLSQSKGKLEISFQKNENPAYESLCLVFIKMPIYGPVVGILQGIIEAEKYNELPLSKGKLSIDSKEDDLHAFVGAIRIKSIEKSAVIILSLIERMRGMLKSAIVLSKRDDIGNMSTSAFKTNRVSSINENIVTKHKPYTFSRDEGSIFNGARRSKKGSEHSDQS